MKHHFFNIAEIEMFEAALYLERESKALGFEFLEEADRCIERLGVRLLLSTTGFFAMKLLDNAAVNGKLFDKG